MNIKSHAHFDSLYKKCSFYQKNLIDRSLELFIENPYHPSLHTHALRKEFAGYWSFSIDANLRILFSEKGGFEEILLIKVGDHETVYETPIFS